MNIFYVILNVANERNKVFLLRMKKNREKQCEKQTCVLKNLEKRLLMLKTYFKSQVHW